MDGGKERGIEVSHTAQISMTLSRCQGDGCHHGDSRSPEGQCACGGLGHTKKDKAALVLPMLTL